MDDKLRQILGREGKESHQFAKNDWLAPETHRIVNAEGVEHSG